MTAATRDLAAERRALDRVSPASRLVASREQVGLLFDRATRALDVRLSRDRARLDRAASTLPRLGQTRLAAARAALEASAGSLGVLGPQATLDRGYAIVRRRPGGEVVRAPQDVPVGAGLDIRLASGSIGATVDATDE